MDPGLDDKKSEIRISGCGQIYLTSLKTYCMKATANMGCLVSTSEFEWTERSRSVNRSLLNALIKYC